MKKEYAKTSTINDKTITLIEEFIQDEISNFSSIKNCILIENFHEFAILMREYGIIIPFQKILFDLSKKYFLLKKD